MSNQAVGNVYQSIIEEVINSSRVDFEESGVEESVLEELRQVRSLSFVRRHHHHPRHGQGVQRARATTIPQRSGCHLAVPFCSVALG